MFRRPVGSLPCQPQPTSLWRSTKEPVSSSVFTSLSLWPPCPAPLPPVLRSLIFLLFSLQRFSTDGPLLTLRECTGLLGRKERKSPPARARLPSSLPFDPITLSLRLGSSGADANLSVLVISFSDNTMSSSQSSLFSSSHPVVTDSI